MQSAPHIDFIFTCFLCSNALTDRIAPHIVVDFYLYKVACLWLFAVAGEEHTAVNLRGVGVGSAEKSLCKLVVALNENFNLTSNKAFAVLSHNALLVLHNYVGTLLLYVIVNLVFHK